MSHRIYPHENPAENIRTVNGLKRHLCDVALYPEEGNRNRSIHPEVCAGCVSQCRYGQKLLALLAEQGKIYTVPERPSTGEEDEVRRIMAVHQNTLTLRDTLRHRRKGY